MIEFECDDALATAAARFAALPCRRARRHLLARQGSRAVRARRTRRVLRPHAAQAARRARRRRQVRRAPRRRYRIGSRSSATAPTAIPAFRAGAPSPRRPCSVTYEKIEAIPADAAEWRVAVRGAAALAASLSRASHRRVPVQAARDAAHRRAARGVARRSALARGRMLRRSRRSPSSGATSAIVERAARLA